LNEITSDILKTDGVTPDDLSCPPYDLTFP